MVYILIQLYQKSIKAKKTLSNFKYRHATLNITVNGFGNIIKKITLNGKVIDKAFIPNDLKGQHEIIIELANNNFKEKDINLVSNQFTLSTPQASKKDSILKWKPIKNTVSYSIYKNGVPIESTTETQIVVKSNIYAAYQLTAINANGYESFASEPIVFSKKPQTIEIENFQTVSELPYTNFSGEGFVEISTTKNKNMENVIKVEKAGYYLLDLSYSNGSGPWNTDNKCAIRSLYVNNQYKGVLVFPQRGKDEWSDWGYTNSKKILLKAGANILKISFEDWNNNMNVDVNTAMIDYLRLIPLDD